MREREALLVSAPTGIGKTIAALYPAVRESLKAGKKLFYLTSKTLQQDAAVSALKMLNDGSFRVLRIRAKQKMCAHTEIICHEDFCPYAAQYSEKMEKSGLLSRITTEMSYFDPDITFEMSKSTEVCPFEVSLELIEQADVIVCDYNYIFDPYVGLKAYQQDNDYGDCVLIVDEAHNLVDRGRGYFSPELHEKTFDAIKHHLASRGCWIEGWEELIDELRAHFHGARRRRRMKTRGPRPEARGLGPGALRAEPRAVPRAARRSGSGSSSTTSAGRSRTGSPRKTIR